MRTLLISALFMLIAAVTATAEPSTDGWPQWRGSDNTGTAPNADPPLEWSEDSNIAWKVDLPGLGHASPVVWGDKVFILTAEAIGEKLDAPPPQTDQEGRPWTLSVDQRQAYQVLAYRTTDGKLIWRTTATETVPHEGRHSDGSFASPSPVTDGEVLVAFFGSAGIFVYRNTDGKLLWEKDLGDMQTRNAFGEGASPVIADGKVIVNWDHEGESDFLIALDKLTGEEIWRTPREGEPTSWSSPIVVEHAGKKQVIVAASGFSRGYDLATGEEIWRVSGMTLNVVPTPVHADGIAYVTSGFRGNAIQAIDLSKARGDITDTEAIIWSDDRETPYVPSPVLHDGVIYFLKRNNGILSALDAKTGDPLYRTRIDVDNIYASPVAADGRIYVVGRDGKALVIKAGDVFEVLATNQLDDGFEASPALVGEAIYLRGRDHLYKVLDSTPKPSENASPSLR